MAEFPAKLPRRPLGWGMQKWGPVPGTRDAWLFWGGPGDGLESYAANPDTPGVVGQRVTHPLGRGPFQTVREADKAAQAFYTEYRRAEQEAGDD